MNVFVIDRIQEQKAFLLPEEAFHCFKVLRRSAGDTINLIDGKGGFYEAKILSISKNSCETEILKHWKEKTKSYYLHLVVAPTKNISRYEWFLEKATEIGVDEITPMISQHSERRKINESRFQKIILSAVKQSLSASIPKLNPLTPFNQIINYAEGSQEYKIFAHLENDTQHIKKLVEPSSKYTILIGPEGDFAEEELEALKEKKWIMGTLGNKRLRTETAGLVAAQIINGIHF